MKTQHTQGEWEVAKSSRGTTYVRTVQEGWSVASITNIDECQANAKLIAAAPDLLEACIRIRNWYERERQDYFGEETPVCFSEALSAINKATK